MPSTPESSGLELANRGPAYAAFISYSLAADGRLAPALQAGLQRFAKPWHKVRAVRVFRDQTGLAVTPELWAAIQSALRQSRWFLLLASPQAAQSKWVEQEVDWWLKHRSSGQLLIVLTEGEVVWDNAAGDFDWTRTTAVPRRLERAFTQEPLHLDLRWARSKAHLSLLRPDFADAIARLSATLRDLPLDELIGEHLRQHRKAMAVARYAGVLLAGIAVLALLAVFDARKAKRMAGSLVSEKEANAEVRANEALSTRLAEEAESLRDTDQELAILLAAEAVSRFPTPAGESALRRALLETLMPARTFDNGADKSCYALFHPNGTQVLTWGTRTLRLCDANSGEVLTEFRGHTQDVVTGWFNKDGGRLCSIGRDGTVLIWDTRTGQVLAEFSDYRAATALLSPDGTRVLLLGDGGAGGQLRDVETKSKVADIDYLSEHIFLTDRVQQASFSADGRRLAVLIGGGNAGVIDVETGGVLHVLDQHEKRVNSVAFSADGRWLVTASEDGTLGRWSSETGRREAILEHGAPLYHGVFSPDGRWVAAQDGARNVLVWEVASGKRAARIQLDPIPEAPVLFNFSPDGKCILTASYDHDFVTVRETSTGQRLADLTVTGRDGPVRTMAFAPDARRVVVGALDGPARLYATDVCGSTSELLALAARRVSRPLTDEERRRYEIPARR